MVRIDLEERSRTLPGGLLRRFGAALFVMCAYLATSTIASATIVLLEARNPESLARFYEDQVGLTVLVRDAEARRTVLGIGDDWLVIAPGGEGESRSAPRILIPVQDLAAARQRLQQHQVAFSEAIVSEGRVQALLFQDPEGNPVGLALRGAPESWLTSWVQEGTYQVPPSGRIELAIWAGLHGIGLGFALPYGLGSESVSLIGLTMMAAGPVAAYAAYKYADEVELTRGQARLIEFAGDFAIWHAAGWSAIDDADFKDALLGTTLAYLGGSAAGALIAKDRPVSAGQAGLLSSGALWGGWYGFVGTRIDGSDEHIDGDDVLLTMLITSSAGALAGGVTAALTDIEESRLRWINFAGILGTAFGFGLDLVLQVDGDAAIWGIPAGTGVAALAYATYATGRSTRGSARDRRYADPTEDGAWGDGPGSGGSGSRELGWQIPRLQPRMDGVRLELLRYEF